jgi:hypothetical protein
MSEYWVGIVALVSVFGSPVVAMYLSQRHRERMKQLDTRAEAGRMAALEAANAELENRVRTLETIATSGDRELEDNLRRVGKQLPSGQRPLLR